MSTDQFTLFFATLGFVALAVAAVIAIGLVVSPRWRNAGAGGGLVDEAARSSVLLAFAVAATATLGSLYYSEVANYVPCQLCWYQRIAMYPLALVLGIAAFRRDLGIWRYGLPLAVLGAAISAYHQKLQAFPDEGSGFCSPEAPCTARHVWEFGFVSIPFMALCGFLAVAALLLLARSAERAESASPPEDSSPPIPEPSRQEVVA